MPRSPTMMSLTKVGNGVGVDVRWELLQSLELRVGDHVILQPEALQAARLAGQLPVHLHGRLVQHLGEEAGRTGNCRTHTQWSFHINNHTHNTPSRQTDRQSATYRPL